MTAISTPVNRQAFRANVPLVALAALLVIVVLVAAFAVFVAGAGSAGTSQASYDAPYYSQYVQDMARGW